MPTANEISPLGTEGHIDAIEGGRIYGWAWNPQQPDSVQKVTVFHEAERLGIVEASRYREDLAAKSVGNGQHAFVFDLPSHLRNRPVSEFSVYMEQSGMALQRGPRVFTIKPDGTADHDAGSEEHADPGSADPGELAHELASRMKALSFRLDKVDESYARLGQILTGMDRRMKAESKVLRTELGGMVAQEMKKLPPPQGEVVSGATGEIAEELKRLEKYLKVCWRDLKRMRNDLQSVEVCAIRFAERLNQAAERDAVERLQQEAGMGRGLALAALLMSLLATAIGLYAAFFG